MSLVTMGADSKDPSAQQVVRTLVEAATRDHRVRWLTSEGQQTPASSWMCPAPHINHPDPGSPRPRRLARSWGRW